MEWNPVQSSPAMATARVMKTREEMKPLLYEKLPSLPVGMSFVVSPDEYGYNDLVSVCAEVGKLHKMKFKVHKHNNACIELGRVS